VNILKRIGIVGGLSPESTILYYKTIIEEYRRRYNDYYYPTIMIYSVNFGEFTDYVRRDIYDKARELLLEAIKALAKEVGLSHTTVHRRLKKILMENKTPITNQYQLIETPA